MADQLDSGASRPAPAPTCPGCQHAAHEGHCLQPVAPLDDLCFCKHGVHEFAPASASPEPPGRFYNLAMGSKEDATPPAEPPRETQAPPTWEIACNGTQHVFTDGEDFCHCRRESRSVRADPSGTTPRTAEPPKIIGYAVMNERTGRMLGVPWVGKASAQDECAMRNSFNDGQQWRVATLGEIEEPS